MSREIVWCHNSLMPSHASDTYCMCEYWNSQHMSNKSTKMDKKKVLEQETFKLWMLKRTNTQHNAQCEHRSSNTRPLQTGNGPHPAVENFQRSVMSWVLAPVYSAFQITKSTLKDFSNMSLFKKVSNINSLLSYLGS